VRDRRRIGDLFRVHRPHIVFHAAAHKHVPMIEANPGEAITNNVFGTKVLADTAERCGAERFVMISTDKAVNPSSVMGVSKCLAERYIHAISEQSSTRFIVVRFGNVLASAGSVVPLFLEQIRRHEPITVTHPEMKRYFMTIPEASQLVLQAAAMGQGGEIFVLDMGQPIKITQLVEDLVRLSGLRLDEVEIKYTGIRPGEKLFEELNFDDETLLPTRHPKLGIAYHRPCDFDEAMHMMRRLALLVHQPPDAIRKGLKQLAPEYVAITAGNGHPGLTAAAQGISAPPIHVASNR
jgi:FlaA1/EpsC-like NDP-sugar epimerase